VIDPEVDKDIDLRRFFDYAKACTMPLLVMAPSQKTLQRVEGLVKEYGIAVAFHHQSKEKDPKFLTTMLVIEAVQGMDPRVGVCIDVLHPVEEPNGTNLHLLDTIRAAGSRLLDVHIKDYKLLADGKKVEVPVGEGILPVVEIFKLLKKANYRGYVNLEHILGEDDPSLGIAKSIGYMRGVVAGLRG
jgi:L-ribulose-5-phosphate 3-epimerase